MNGPGPETLLHFIIYVSIIGVAGLLACLAQAIREEQ